MQKSLNLAVGSMHTFAHDVAHNEKLILELIHEAKENEAQLLLLPELSLSGYGVEDLFLSDAYVNGLLSHLESIMKAMPDGILVVVGLPILIDSKRYNAVALLKKDKIIGIVCKQHLAHIGIHYEPRWFSPWPKAKRTEMTIAQQKVPVGDLLFDIDEVKIGFEICEDAWVPNRVGIAHHRLGVDVILNPSASHFAVGKQTRRRQLVVEAAKQFECLYVYSNLLGCETGRAIYDGVNIACYRNKLLLETIPFSFREMTLSLLQQTIDIKPASKELKKEYIRSDFSWHKNQQVPSHKQNMTMPSTNEAVCMAIARGLWDWQQKTKTTGYVVSLSGGADSALCASLVALSHWMAYRTLGETSYLNALRDCGINLPTIDKNESLLPQIMPSVLKTVYQGSKHSSDTTQKAAKALAAELHASHIDWSIDGLVDDYLSLAEKALGHALTWASHDIALQNIQARVRSPGVWLLANVENKLLIATSNLSEAVVGYCTMDGDTSGVLAPIGGVSKTRVLALNRFLMKEGLTLNGHRFTLPALSHIVKQTPTAELRPSEQTDEGDLMPYEVLDAIRELAQVDFLPADEILQKLKTKTFEKQYDTDALKRWRDKYFQLYYRNQWKRERLAPSFHIEIDSACPKTYRRFPII